MSTLIIQLRSLALTNLTIENELLSSTGRVVTPKFLTNSYLEFPAYTVQESNTIQVSFRTAHENGTLLYAVQDYRTPQAAAYFIHLYVENGVLFYHFSCFIERFLVDTNTLVNRGNEVSVIIEHVSRPGCRATVSIDNGTSVQAGRPTYFFSNVGAEMGPVYMGGVPPTFDPLTSSLPVYDFQGCVSELIINTDPYDFPHSLGGQNVEECDVPTASPPPSSIRSTTATTAGLLTSPTQQTIKPAATESTGGTEAGGNQTTVIIIVVAVCGLVLVAIIAVTLFVVRRRKPAHEEPVENHPNPLELDRVGGNTNDGYQSLRIPQTSAYQGLTAHSAIENETTPGATYEDVKLPFEFPRDRLEIKERLGEGEFGEVYKAEAWRIASKPGTTTVAVKTVKMNYGPASLTVFNKELAILKVLGTHRNVLSFLGCCTDTEPFYLLLEYVSGGSLQSNLRTSRTQQTYGNLHGCSKSLSSRDLTKFAWDVAKGMTFLASKKIIHRDLATRNVLVAADKTCKVSDFGFSREGDAYESTTETRLPIRWMAPESLFHRKYTTKTDVWAFGVLLWEIVTLGATPYPGMSKREVMDGVQQGYRMDKPPHCDKKLYTLMLNCWKADPAQRPEFYKIQRTLNSLMEIEHDYISLASLDENAYTPLQTATDEKY
ncbi:fibroblast growth factor receptor-like [Branchiostoma floridae x Branchiostoma japonicum]